ncbi:hypothetical protein P4V86_05580 [Brevibacillus laterosporus]|nr:hypothetical protein [Brevibacillus laterosporus]
MHIIKKTAGAGTPTFCTIGWLRSRSKIVKLFQAQWRPYFFVILTNSPIKAMLNVPNANIIIGASYTDMSIPSCYRDMGMSQDRH